jgi:hypothetical protein
MIRYINLKKFLVIDERKSDRARVVFTRMNKMLSLVQLVIRPWSREALVFVNTWILTSDLCTQKY